MAILGKNCTECHNSGLSTGNVGDVTNLDYLLYTRLVVPGEPEISPLIQSIISGGMPMGKTPLSGSEVQILKDWISGLDASSANPLPPVAIIPLGPNYASLEKNVFQPYCVACHAGRNFKLNSYEEVLRTITAGNPDGSLLTRSVTVGATGGRMPQGGALSQAQIDAIKQWIAAGLPRN